MAGKISEYPSKTVFNDTDLYDVSTGGTTTEKVTYSQLKDDLKNTFIEKDTWTTLDISALITPQLSGMSYSNISTSGSLRYITQDKIMTIMVTCIHNFTYTSGTPNINNYYDIDFSSVLTGGSFVNDFDFTHHLQVTNSVSQILDRYAQVGDNNPVQTGKIRLYPYGLPTLTPSSDYTVTMRGQFQIQLT